MGELTGTDWLNSREQREFNAAIAQQLRPQATILTQLAYNIISPFGYGMFTQERIGQNGKPFPLLKLQTMASTDIPHTAVTNQQTAPIQQDIVITFIRDLALDEIVQFFQISIDPDVRGQMSFVGIRPQLEEELEIRERMLVAAGHETLAQKYLAAYQDVPPALYGPESLVSATHEPGSLAYVKACADSVVWYHDHASRTTDTMIIYAVMCVGAQLLERHVDTLARQC